MWRRLDDKPLADCTQPVRNSQTHGVFGIEPTEHSADSTSVAHAAYKKACSMSRL